MYLCGILNYPWLLEFVDIACISWYLLQIQGWIPQRCNVMEKGKFTSHYILWDLLGIRVFTEHLVKYKHTLDSWVQSIC